MASGKTYAQEDNRDYFGVIEMKDIIK
jgi:hypothetical protein